MTDHETEQEWVVYSTCLSNKTLLVQCVETLQTGTVVGPSPDEWERASNAPSQPYRWNDQSRILVYKVQEGYRYVWKSSNGEYVRIWSELFQGVPLEEKYDAEYLFEIAEKIEKYDLSSDAVNDLDLLSAIDSELAVRLDDFSVFIPSRSLAETINEYADRCMTAVEMAE